MKIATPVSHLFENPETAWEIIKYSDCLECRERNIKLEFPDEHLFHIDVDLTQAWDDKRKNYIKGLTDIKQKLQLISFQATSCYSDPFLKDGMYYPGGERLTYDQMISYAVDNVRWLRTVLKKNVLISFENTQIPWVHAI